MPSTGTTSNWELNIYDPILKTTFTTKQESSFQWNDTVSMDVTIGAYDTDGTAVVGDVDLAALGMWRRALTNGEIIELINDGKGLNFGASNFKKITRVYWDSQKKRDGDEDTF